MTRGTLTWALAAGIGALGAFAGAGAQQRGEVTDVQITGFVYKPASVEPTPDRLRGIRLPEGFRIERFADGLENVRMLAVAGDGTVYATRHDQGDVVMLRDNDNDGRADQRRVVARKPMMHGVAVHGKTLYMATPKEVYAANIQRDGTLGKLRRLIGNLPDGGQHPNRTLAVGPDGMLYISVGSSCNVCEETNPEHAALLRATTDGKSRSTFASGLRNTVGFGWHPRNGNLYGFDHGSDWMGNDDPREEFNHIVKDGHYGWPYVSEKDMFHPRFGSSDINREEWITRNREPALMYEPHTAPMQMVFYTGTQFPEEYRGDAFVAMRGSWNRKPPVGYQVVRVHFENGRPTRIEPFADGFLVRMDEAGEYGHLGRLAGIAQARDGALLVSDDHNGIIYRIAYEERRNGQPERGNGQPE